MWSYSSTLYATPCWCCCGGCWRLHLVFWTEQKMVKNFLGNFCNIIFFLFFWTQIRPIFWLVFLLVGGILWCHFFMLSNLPSLSQTPITPRQKSCPKENRSPIKISPLTRLHDSKTSREMKLNWSDLVFMWINLLDVQKVHKNHPPQQERKEPFHLDQDGRHV